jgi:hypothetical protein
MRMRILSILSGVLFTATPFAVSNAAPAPKDICVQGGALCDHGNRNNNRSTSTDSGGGEGGGEGCGGGSESSRGSRKGKSKGGGNSES